MDDPAAGWSGLHLGLDPRANRLLWCWLRAMWWLARPLVRLRVRPAAVTGLGVALGLGAALVARGEPWVAAGLVLGSVIADGLDGAVAVLAGRATRLGALADKAADRICDVAFAAVLWRCGSPWWLAVIAALAMLAVESLHELRPVAITVAERPSRAICTVLACGSVALSSARWPVAVCTGVLIGLSAVAVLQLSRSDVRAS